MEKLLQKGLMELYNYILSEGIKVMEKKSEIS